MRFFVATVSNCSRRWVNSRTEHSSRFVLPTSSAHLCAAAHFSTCPFSGKITKAPSTTARQEIEVPIDYGQHKSIKDIPGPPSLPILGNYLSLLRDGAPKFYKSIQAIDSYHNKYGPIVKLHGFGRMDVFLNNPKWVQAVLRTDGAFPRRAAFPMLEKYQKAYQRHVILLTNDQAEWKQDREALNPHFFNLETMKQLDPFIQNVAVDMAESIAQEVDPETGEHPDLLLLGSRLGLEGVSAITFGQRLGCFPPNGKIDPTNTAFAKNFLAAFEQVGRLFFVSPVLYNFSPRYYQMCHHFEQMWKIGGEMVEKYLLQDQRGGNNEDELQKTALIKSLVNNSGWDVKKATAVLIGFSSVGTDTTAWTLLWCLYELANHPEHQQAIRDEFDAKRNEQKNGKAVDGEAAFPVDVSKLSTLGNFMQECFRYHPAAHQMSRILNEDVVVDGYLLPKDTHVALNNYSMGRNPDIFENPMKFDPSRWDFEKNSTSKEQIRWMKTAVQPFSVGPRKCIGARLARMELRHAILQILTKFDLELNPTESRQLDGRLALLFVPEHIPKIRFRPRQ